MAEQTPHAVIELNLGSEPISGVVREADGRASSFSGYVGLLALLHRLHDSTVQAGTSVPADTEGTA